MRKQFSIFTLLLTAFAALGPFTVRAAGTIQVTTFGVFHPGSDSLDGFADALNFFDPKCTQKIVYKVDGPFPVSLKTIPQGWKVNCWMEQNSFCLRPSDYTGKPIDGTEEASSFTYTEDHIDKGGVSYLAVKFQYIKYDLAYNSAGGTPTPTGGTYSYDEQFQLATAPSRTGYTFGGWLASSVARTFAAGATVSGANLCPDTWHEDNHKVTLTAQWTANTYTVTFNPTGGSTPSMTSKSVTYDSTYGELATCSRAGYRFDGWWTAESGGTQVTSGTKVSTAESHTLYARWTALSFTITLETHGALNPTPTSVSVTYGETPASIQPIPQYSDGTFGGYFEEENGGGRKFWNAEGIWVGPDGSGSAWTWTDISKLHAKVSYNPLRTVHFNPTGGTFEGGGMQPVQRDYLIGGPFGTFPSVVWADGRKVFAGWFTDPSGGVQVREGDIVERGDGGAALILYAHWDPASYFISFDGNGATNEGAMAVAEFKFDVPTNLPLNVYGKTGYTFGHWRDASGKVTYTNGHAGVVNVLDTEAGATNVLYAVWETNTYTVAFNPNGASGTMEPQEFVYDRPQRLQPCAFDRGSADLWSFAGWTNSAAGGPLYTNCEEVVNLCAEDGGTVTLDAVWKSELSELALALGCDNLNWENESASGWKADTVDFFGKKIPCVTASGSTLVAMWSTAFTTNGVLHFWWRATGDRLSVQCQGNPGGTWPSTWNWRLTSADFIPDAWHETNLVVRLSDIENVGNGRFYIMHRYDSTCWIAKMTWTPEGTHPEPGPGDAVKISSAAVSDGKFTLTFPSKAEFNYNLLTNANLLIDSWGVMGTEEGTGGNVIFEPEIVEGQPQLFYKVETIQRK